MMGLVSGQDAEMGVAKVINDYGARAIYTHHYGHALNLSVGDTIRQCQVTKAVIDVVVEISKLHKKSPKYDALFEKIKASLPQIILGFVYFVQRDGLCELLHYKVFSIVMKFSLACSGFLPFD